MPKLKKRSSRRRRSNRSTRKSRTKRRRSRRKVKKRSGGKRRMKIVQRGGGCSHNNCLGACSQRVCSGVTECGATSGMGSNAVPGLGGTKQGIFCKKPPVTYKQCKKTNAAGRVCNHWYK